MATKSKKKTKIEIAKNEDPREEPSNDARGRGRTEFGIEDLPGVGPATAEKLREAGFDDLLSLAVMSPADLAEQAEIGEAVASKIIAASKKMANIGGFVSGGQLLERREKFKNYLPRFNLSMIY